MEGTELKKALLAASVISVVSTAALAENIGVTMASFDDRFLSIILGGMVDYAAALDDVDLHLEDARNDVSRQLGQIEDFIAAGVDAIIVNPADTDATIAMTEAAAAAGVPLVYVNRQPVNLDELPDNQAFVASDERESGTLQTREICRLLIERGKGDGADVVVMMGELSQQAGRQRTQDIHDIIATPECSFMNIVEEQTASWLRTKAAALMADWLSVGVTFDALIANNDEMAIGGIQAMKAAGVSTTAILVGGIDATQDALEAMAAGDLDVTVFQNAVGQGTGSVDAALALARGEAVDQVVFIPFELVVPSNMADYQARN